MSDVKAIKTYLAGGMTVIQVARHTGLSRARVYQIIKEHGIALPKPDKGKFRPAVKVKMVITSYDQEGRETVKEMTFRSPNLKIEIKPED